MSRTISIAAVVLAITLLAVGVAAPASAQTAADIETRDSLIQNQENLLNIYRCRFGIDTHIVPGGCVDGKPAEPQQRTDSGSGEHPESISGWVLDSGENDTGAWWSYDRYADPSNTESSPGIVGVCHTDSAAFSLFV